MSFMRKKSAMGQTALLGSFSFALLLTALWAGAAPPQKKAAAKVAGLEKKPVVPLRYNRDIRPILAENCFACHGPDSASRKAGMRLDRAADATLVRDGRAPIVKGKPEASLIIQRINGKGPIMPPRDSHKTMTPPQIALLTRWVKEGAEYEPHWAYIAPKRPALPTGSGSPLGKGGSGGLWKTWVRNPIDRFILAKLEQAGLQPAPEADKRTLARRLSLDLTGLPPAPADVEAFVADKSPNAYDKLVEKFLASPQWGEHRGRYWLDAARYADTHGIHFDNYREMWSYRDWVINAFNKNMRFDEFTIEQLAGDLLPNPTLDQRVATGFNRCNITTNEGGAIDEEYKVLYTRDRTETASAVWLASTLQCAVCHDHKFDPFSQKDFYSMSAFFNNTTQNAMDGNIKDTPPVMPVPLPNDRERWDAIKGELAAAKTQAESRKQAARADFDRWMADTNANKVSISVPNEGLKFHLPLSEGQGKEVQATFDGQPLKLTATGEPGWEPGQTAAKAFQRKAGSTFEIPQAGDFEKDQAFTAAAWVKLTPGAGGAILARMDESKDFRGWDLWVEGNRIGTHIINKWPDDALKTVTRDALEAGKWYHVCVTYGGEAKLDSIKVYINGTVRATDPQASSLKNTIRTTVPLKIGQRHTTAGMDGTMVQDVRLYGRALSGDEVNQLSRSTRAAYLASRGAANLAAAEKDELFGWWLTGQDVEYRDLSGKVAALENEQRAIQSRGTIALVSQEKSEEAMAFLLYRGEYDKRKDPLKPLTPASLPPMPNDYPKNRLGFAKWLLLPNHPLTARVTVNRFWQELFGNGLVKTAGDFGVNGELPTHPELLDWLAIEFREGGWDVKKFFKMLVTSATYRQATVITPEKKRRDGANRLLSRGPRFRMDAEMVRDYALAASGLLVRKLGGPSVKPYQPEGVWEAVAMIGSNTRDYRRDTGENLYRRSLYTFWKRAAPPASMDILNAPNRETCVVQRERTNTPLQALLTMNDVQFIEAARVLAQAALKEGGNATNTRMDFLARRLLSRPFTPKEQAIVAKSLSNLESFYKGHSKEAKELIAVGESKADETVEPERLAAWTMLTNQLMNLDEVLNK
jgi:hypothetical protein